MRLLLLLLLRLLLLLDTRRKLILLLLLHVVRLMHHVIHIGRHVDFLIRVLRVFEADACEGVVAGAHHGVGGLLLGLVRVSGFNSIVTSLMPSRMRSICSSGVVAD